MADPVMTDTHVHDEILRSTVRLARLTFRAGAASIFLYDRDRDVLVFEALSGEGEDRLMGQATSADAGIAGWVFRSGESMLIDDLANEPRFNRAFAEQTGYVPNRMLAASLSSGDEPIGVLEVLDPDVERIGKLEALEVLAELGHQCSCALQLVLSARGANRALRATAEPSVLGLAATLSELSASDDAGVRKLLQSLGDVLESRRPDRNGGS